MQENWLPTLPTDTPEEGYDLAVKLARKAVGMTQPDAEIKKIKTCLRFES